MSRLVIVESPTKARTIHSFLPDDYVVEACMGHVRDLPPSAKEIPQKYKELPWARLGVDVENDFAPLYVIPSDKKAVIKKLKDLLKDANELILATDEDREGESIGWHLAEVLKPKVPIKRMVFHEITREAIEAALQDTRTIDQQLVRAQETRRILDRLVGYTVSPLLWKKISPGLSAGRVQSVAVDILVEREQRRLAFHSGSYWDLRATLEAYRQRFTATLSSIGGVRVASGKDFDENTGEIRKGAKVLLLNEQQAAELKTRLDQGEWSVVDVNERVQNRRPPPPFTTSTLQQEANRKLRLSSKETMRVAQRLYENGYITYMRTDSVHLSNEAIQAARTAVKARYGAEYLSKSPRQYTTKSKAAQEAHEAIRPAGNQMRTADELGLSGAEYRLYDMIWKRTMATQMAEAVVRFLDASLQVDDAIFQATGKRIDFPGYFRAYVEGSDDPDAALDDQESPLPPLKVGDGVDCRELLTVGHETIPPARFTEASLVQSLEKEGVGRPSTYATIISTIQERGYVVKDGNRLIPTFMAFTVSRLLEEHFPDLVDTQFTARMEQTLDDIAAGEVDWLPYLREFYCGEEGLESLVEAKTQTIDPRAIYALELEAIGAKVRIGRYGPYIERENGDGVVRASLPPTMPPSDLTIEEAEQFLRQKDEGPEPIGLDPETGLPVFLLRGPYGYYVQLGDSDEEKPKRTSLPRGMNPEDVTFEAALGLLALPRKLGLDPETGDDIYAGIGRFGPYVRRGDAYKSLTKADHVLSVDLPRALELLSQVKKFGVLREIGPHPDDGELVTVNHGRYGPYIKYKRTNAAIPKGVEPESVTMEMALKFLTEKKAAPKKGTTAKSKAKSKTSDSKEPSKATKKPRKSTKPTKKKGEN